MRNRDVSFHDHTGIAIDKGEVNEKSRWEALDSIAHTDTRCNLYQIMQRVWSAFFGTILAALKLGSRILIMTAVFLKGS